MGGGLSLQYTVHPHVDLCMHRVDIQSLNSMGGGLSLQYMRCPVADAIMWEPELDHVYHVLY